MEIILLLRFFKNKIAFLIKFIYVYVYIYICMYVNAYICIYTYVKYLYMGVFLVEKLESIGM